MSSVVTLSILRSQDAYFFQLMPTVSSNTQDTTAPLGLVSTVQFDKDLQRQLAVAAGDAAERLRALYTDLEASNEPSHVEASRAFENLGRMLFSYLLPSTLKEELLKLANETSLLIATNDTELPWELLHNGQDYLALKHPVGRQMLSWTAAEEKPPSYRTTRAVLFITDPTGDLPEAQEEVEQLLNLFDDVPHIDPQVMGVQAATRLKVLEALSSGKYDIIHYSGHAKPGALILADGEVTSQDIQQALQGRPFIFLNACQSSASDAQLLDAWEALPSAGLATCNLATAFIQGGASGFVGTLWKVFDAGSGIFAQWFYSMTLQGKPVGEALRQARLNLLKDRPFDPLWASYVLYGNPMMYLPTVGRHQVRSITVTVIHIANMFEMFSALGLERAAELEYSLLDQLAQIAHRYGGENVNWQTHLVEMRFGVAYAHENSATHAVRAALEVLQFFTAFNQSRTDTLFRPLSVRIGISTGHVISRHIYSSPKGQLQISSNIGMRAAILAEQAPIGSIWIDTATQTKASSIFVLEPVDERDRSEDNSTIDAYCVQAERSKSLEHSISIPLLGRAAELAQLQEWFARAAAGRGGLVDLAGAAGVGKSQLVRALRNVVSEQSHRWITVSCHPHEREHPYALLRQIIFGLAEIFTTDDESEQHDKLRQLVHSDDAATSLKGIEEYHHKALALLGFAIGLHISHPVVDKLTREMRQKDLGRLFQVVLATQAQQQTIVIAVEDMDNIDETSLYILEGLAKSLGRMSVLVLAIHRTEWSHTWLRSEHLYSLNIPELNEAASHELLRYVLGMEAFPEYLEEVILKRTGGNPLFIEEMIKTLQESKILVRVGDTWRLTHEIDDTPLPDRVETVIQARLDRLDDINRRVLEKAAVIGAKFDDQVLAPIQPEPVRRQLDLHLNELDQHSFIYSDPLYLASYIFTHGLVHQAVYSNIVEDLRRAIHRQVAQVLRRLFGDNHERLPYHYYHSNDRVNAIRHCLYAGEHAAEQWANQTARTWYERAEEKLQSFETRPPTASEEAQGATEVQIQYWHIQALAGMAKAQQAIGLNDMAVTNYSQALEMTDERDDYSDTERAELHRYMAMAHHDMGDLAAAWELLQSGLALLDNDHHIEAGRIHYWLGVIQFRRGEPEDALVLCERGATISLAANSTIDVAQARNLQGMIYLNLGHIEDAIRAHEQSIANYQAAEHRPGQERAISNLGVVFQTLSQWSEALACYQKSASLCEETGEERRKAAALINLGEIYRRQGKLNEAIDAYAQAHSIGEQFDLPEATGLAQMNLGASYLKQENWDIAAQHLEESRTTYDRIGTRIYFPELLRYQAELHIHTGNATQALPLAQEAQQLASELDHMQVGPTRRVMGQAHHALGQPTEAESQLNESLALLRRNDPYEAALTLMALALLFDTRANTEATSESLRKQAIAYCNEAVATFTRLGAQLDLERAQDIRKRLQ